MQIYKDGPSTGQQYHQTQAAELILRDNVIAQQQKEIDRLTTANNLARETLKAVAAYADTLVASLNVTQTLYDNPPYSERPSAPVEIQRIDRARRLARSLKEQYG